MKVDGREITMETPKQLVHIVVGQTRRKKAFWVAAKIPPHAHLALARSQFCLFKCCILWKTAPAQGYEREASVLGGCWVAPLGGGS